MLLLIFDCDGVLRSVSYEAIYAAYLAIAAHVNCNPDDFWNDVNAFKKWHHNDWHYNLERMGVPRGSDYSQITTIFHDIYDSTVHKFHWVEEILGSLAQKHQLAVLSSAKSASVRFSLDESACHFSHIIGLDNVSNIKPHPEGINKIMGLTGSRPEYTVMIGDSDADILAGKNAGVRTAGVAWGMSEVSELQKLDPDYLLLDPMQLKDF